MPLGRRRLRPTEVQVECGTLPARCPERRQNIRLSRNAAFLLTLMDTGVRFVAADDPTVGVMLLVAEQEREAISRRTREALAAGRARGVR